MSAITVVEFENAVHTEETYLSSELADGPPYTVHGVALGAGDVTKGKSGVKKKWPAEELRRAAETLEGTNLVEDHENSAAGVIGRVTKAGYKSGTGIVYQAELYDDDLAEKIENGLLEVSVRGLHADVDTLEEDSDTGALLVEDIEFKNLSIVPTGASPSNTLEMGEHAELSAAELAIFTDTLAELAEVEPGMWVQWGGEHGITISQVQDGEIEVDIYEEDGDEWRSTEETTMVPVNDLSEWEIEEDSIGAAPDKDEDDSEEENAPIIEAGMRFFSSVNDSIIEVVKVEGNRVHLSGEDDDSSWVEPKEEVFEKLGSGEWRHAGDAGMSELADATFSRGDWVRWDTRNSTEIGKVTGSYMEGDDIPDIRGDRGLSPEGDDILYTLRMYKERDGSWHPIEGKPIGHYEDSVRSAEKPSDVSESTVELDQHEVRPDFETPAFKQGDWVKLTFYDSVIARVNYIHREDEKLELSLYEIVDGELRNTGHTAEIGYSNAYIVDADDVDGIDMLPSMEENQGPNPPEFDEGDMVQWQVAPSMKGQIVHNPPNQDIIMVEVMREKDGEMVDTGFTVTAGYSDLQHIDESAADGSHGDPSSDEGTDTGNDGQYSEAAQSSSEHLTIDEFVEWFTQEAELSHGVEGVDERLDSDEAIRRMKENDAAYMAFVYQDSEELGRSNAENYTNFREGDWVQWYTDSGERHGKVTAVDSDSEQVSVQSWIQRSDGKWMEGDATVTKAFDDKIEGWGNFPRGQEEFAIDGEDPRRAVQPDDEENSADAELISNQTEKALKNKVEEHNDEHGDDEAKRVTYRMLKNVYNRGAGAYNDSHREGMSQQQWAMARVNAFLYLVRNGNPENDAYKQDNDLLPEEHEKYNEDAPDENEAENSAVLAQSYDDYPEAASENAQMALDAKADTGNPNDCGTGTGWKRARQLANGEPVSREQLGKMSAFNRHRQNSAMEDEEGRADCGWMMWKAWGGDAGVDWAQEKLNGLEEEARVEELVDYDMHEVTYDGTTEQDWNSPDMEDFDTDDLEEIARHFLISTTGFPPENYGDLKLPVVEPNGELNVNALAAVKGGRGVSAVDGLSSSMENDIVEYVNGLANRKFDRNWENDSEEEMSYNKMDKDTDDDIESETAASVPESHRFEDEADAKEMAQEMGIEGAHAMMFDGEEMWVPGSDHETYMEGVSEEENTINGVRVLPGDDLRQAYKGASETDSTTNYKLLTTMEEQIEEKLSELSEPVAVEADELQELQDKADRFEELSESVQAIRERTEILDEVDRSAVEELAESDDPVVVESARYEDLQSEAEQVKGVYAAQLSEHYDAFDADELADKFSIEELREKFEDQFGSIEELADSTDAEPQSQDPVEEELQTETRTGSTEELSDEIERRQQELRSKIGIGGE